MLPPFRARGQLRQWSRVRPGIVGGKVRQNPLELRVSRVMVRSGTEQFITDNLPADDGFLWVSGLIDTARVTVLTEMMAFWY